MTFMGLVMTLIKAASVFALLGLTVRLLKRIDHRRAVSGAAPRGRRARRGQLRGALGFPSGRSGRHRAGAGAEPGSSRPGTAGMARLLAVRGRRGPQRTLEVVERATLGRTAAVVLLRVGDRQWLVGVTDQQVSVLSAVDPPGELDLRAGTTMSGTAMSGTAMSGTALAATTTAGPEAASPPAGSGASWPGWAGRLGRTRLGGGRDHIELLDADALGNMAAFDGLGADPGPTGSAPTGAGRT